MITACKNKDGDDDERNHSRPMSYQDMMALFDASQRKLENPQSSGDLTVYANVLFERAFSTTGFTLWTR